MLFDAASPRSDGQGNTAARLSEPPLPVPRHVTVHEQAHLLVVRIDRSPVNAFTQEMFCELLRVAEIYHADPRPVVLTGAHSTFSAGFDVKAPRQDAETTETAAVLAVQCLRAVESHPAPVVAAVERVAIGFGFLLAATADLLVTSPTTRFGMPEAKLGMMSDVRPLQRYLSNSWIRRLSLFGEILTADEMHLERSGVVVCPSGSVEQTAIELAVGLEGCDTAVLRDTKRYIASLSTGGPGPSEISSIASL
jgi:enoyl-CoA hydratase/carnithine racemase